MRAESDIEAPEDTAALTAHDVAAIIIVRDDGTCTVAWGRAWCVWEAMPGLWANAQEAMRAVQQVIGHAITWRHGEPRLWEGRQLDSGSQTA